MNTNSNIESKYELKKNLIIILMEYILGFLLVLSNNSVYFHETSNGLDRLIVILILGITGILAFSSLLSIMKSNLSMVPLLKLLFVNIIIVLTILGISFYIDRVEMSSLIRMLLFSPLAITYIFMYSSYKKIPMIVFFIKKIVVFLAILSLVIYIPYTLGIIHATGSTAIDWGGFKLVSNVYNIQFFPQLPVNFLGHVMPRNTGIFTEAPMFAYVLTIALIIHLFLEKNEKLIDITGIILVIAIFTTTSTTGVILAIFAYFLKVYSNLTGYKKTVIFFFLIIVIFAVYVILESKFTSMADSASLRVDDFRAGFKALRVSPLLGNGLVKGGDVIRMFMQPNRVLLYGNDGFSSGLFYSLARIGILGTFAYILFPILVFANKNYSYFCFSLVFFMLFVFTTVFYSYLFLFFVLIMYTSILYKRGRF